VPPCALTGSAVSSVVCAVVSSCAGLVPQEAKMKSSARTVKSTGIRFIGSAPFQKSRTCGIKKHGPENQPAPKTPPIWKGISAASSQFPRVPGVLAGPGAERISVSGYTQRPYTMAFALGYRLEFALLFSFYIYSNRNTAGMQAKFCL